MGGCLVDCEEGEISFGGFLFYFTGMVVRILKLL
jgi:hypothetical protein